MRVPPKLAPIEIVIVPIVQGGDRRTIVRAGELGDMLRNAGFRVRVDSRDERPGWKYSEWEMRGVPIRIELGPRDLEAESAVVVRRDREKNAADAKQTVRFADLPQKLREVLGQIQLSMYLQAKSFLDSHTFRPLQRDEFFELCRSRAGMVEIPWCGRIECEALVKEATGATTRNVHDLNETARCVACGEPAKVLAYFAQSY
ncbi:MAG: hypothetical protein JOZ38_07880 [Candidatus Eremiobacteraeota bacterium]|nr:hypothetical protein [Candidatus Eremiobacteraeota bacterium]